MAPQKKIQGKLVQLYAGLDMIGNKQTIHSREAEIDVLPFGVRIKSRKTKRQFVIFSSNIRGVELLPGNDDLE